MSRLDEIRKAIDGLEHLATVIEAGDRGEQVQFENAPGDMPTGWSDVYHGNLTYGEKPSQYRIKPTGSPLDVNGELLGLKVIKKSTGSCHMVMEADGLMIWFCNCWVTAEQLQADYTHLDGSPCEKGVSDE